MRYAAVCVVLVLVAVCPVASQETTGEVFGSVASEDGAPLPGVSITIEDPEIGQSRSIVSSANGAFRFLAVSPGGYVLTAERNGFQPVRKQLKVNVGRSTTIDLVLEVGSFESTIEVTDTAPLIDTRSTVAGITADVDELSSRLPISRDVTAVALLAPGSIAPDPRFGVGAGDTNWMGTPGQSVPAVSGASAGENTYLVNGLNTTNLFFMVGSSFVPMEFVEEVQVKTGGYSAEFGRSTGGVINMVTKSGTNLFHGGVSLYVNPETLQEQEADTYQIDDAGNTSLWRANSSESHEALEANLSLGGPIVRDHLFFFAFMRYTDWNKINMTEPTVARDSSAADPYWGGKLDWLITNSHRFEGTFLSDETTVDHRYHFVDPSSGQIGSFLSDGYSLRGGQNWILKYTGMLGPRGVLSAQAGVNPFARSNRTKADDTCPAAVDFRDGTTRRVGCWVIGTPMFLADERRAYRMDVDWIVGDHALRAGVDAETNTSKGNQEYSGGIYYRYYLNGMEGAPSDFFIFPELPWDQELVRANIYSVGGSFDSTSNAAYIQDSWHVARNLTLNLGVRWERFSSDKSNGEPFMEVNDQVAPRIGLVWDPSGSGRSKLFASFGTYFLPMANEVTVLSTGAYYRVESWYPLIGDISEDGSPEGLGDELAYRVLSDGEVPDTREILADEFDPMSQSEVIVGYERLIGSSWSIGVRGVARRFNDVIEDVTIDRALWEKYGVPCTSPDAIAAGEACIFNYVYTNPGSDFSGWYDLDGDGELDPIDFTAEELGYPDAKREYLALEFSASRRYSDGWALGASYTWSHLYGNYEGFSNSDAGAATPYLTPTFDVAANMEHSDGDLPNDRRHNIKVFGSYALDVGLQLSANAWFQSGRPINACGLHPTDPWARVWGSYAFFNQGRACPRGCAGVTENAWALDLGVRYDWRWLGAEWFVRADSRNVFNNGSVVTLEEEAQQYNGSPNPNYLQPRYYQEPRTVRFGFGIAF
jgi:hypothetical protein